MTRRQTFLPPGAVLQGNCTIASGSTLSAADGDIIVGSAGLSGANIPTLITKTANLASFASNSATSAQLVFGTTIPANARVLGADVLITTACTGSATASATRCHIGTSANVAGFLASANIHSGQSGIKMGPVGAYLNSGNYNVAAAARSAIIKIMVSGGATLSSLSSLNVTGRIMYQVPRS